ncbi:MAG: AMP-binding protein [Acidobacteria bacterium]|nr:AMP-binding protein [Acidobacteriota bacterium]
MYYSFADRTIPRILETAARTDGRMPLLKISGREYTLAEINEEVNRLAHGLLERGIQKGTPVGILSSSRVEMIFLWLALAKTGALCVPINTSFHGSQLSYVLTHARLKFLLLGPECLGQFLKASAGIVVPPELIALDEETAGQLKGHFSITLFSNLLSQKRQNIEPVVQPPDLFSVIYTGGTTGPSKGVLCSQCQYYWWGSLMARSFEVSASDTWFTCLPFFHSNAQITFLAMLLVGGRMVIANGFDPDCFWDQARQCGATLTSLVGTMPNILYYRKKASPLDRRHSVKVVFCPGMSGELKSLFEERFGVQVMNAYGMTELNVISVTPRGTVSPSNSMGITLPEFELKIVDEADQEVEAGTPGEIIVRPREAFSIMSGYFQMPEHTVQAWRNLWFHTGDRAYRDDAGHLYFVDRAKDSIRRSKCLISSFQLEQLINTHEDVLESAAYGVPGTGEQEDIAIALVLRPGRSLEIEQFARWCRKRLLPEALPRFVDITTELPKTPVGRVEKYKLRCQGPSAAAWDLQATQSQSHSQAKKPLN